MEIEKIKKLLLSISLDDVLLGVEILSKKPTEFLQKVVKSINGTKNKDKHNNSTYCIKIKASTEGREDVYIAKGRYYYSVYASMLYIDHCTRASRRIASGDTELLVSLLHESTETTRSNK